MTPGERAPVLERVEQLFEEHAVDGLVELPYVTECFRAARRREAFGPLSGWPLSRTDACLGASGVLDRRTYVRVELNVQ